MKRDLHLRWLRAKRHLRSCSASARARRDAARAISNPTPIAAPARGWLCRSAADRLAA
jgi:hypothetical protein